MCKGIAITIILTLCSIISIFVVICVTNDSDYRLNLLGSAAAKYTNKILVVLGTGISEGEVAQRLKIAGERIGIKLIIFSHNTIKKDTIKNFSKKPAFTRYAKKFNIKPALACYSKKFPQQMPIEARNRLNNAWIKKFNPDFALFIQDTEDVKSIPGITNYYVLDLGIEHYVTNINGKPVLNNQSYYDYDQLFTTLDDVGSLPAAFEARGDKNFLNFTWYYTTFATNYTPAQPKKLFYTGGAYWDTSRNSQEYRKMFALLDKKQYMEICGVPKQWSHTPNSYKGWIVSNGVSVIEAMHEAGIALILHTKNHLSSGAPSARIFEAVAANTVIITDRHPFIMKHFKDNVLYIDITRDGTNIFKQIDTHMQWIYKNPKLAQQMADRCHDIFLEKFTAEQQLLKLLDYHKHYVQLLHH